MSRLRIVLFLLALWAGACNRQAGTEVGNPEITMNARFSIRDTAAMADIPELNLKVMGMSWTMSYQSATCWNDTGGRMVDFAANAMPLTEVKVRDGEWNTAVMVLEAAPGDSTLPAASGFAAWSHPRYAKLVKVIGADTVRALFRMPENLQLRLMFGKASIKSWRQGAVMIVDVKFDVGTWAAGLRSNPAYRFRTDGNNVRYLVLSPTENAATYETMKSLLPKAFMADSTDML